MPSPTDLTVELPRVGVHFDARGKSVAEVVSLIQTNTTTYMKHMWTTCYLISDLYQRDDWKAGINGRPRNEHFARYMADLMPHRGFTVNELMTFVDVYRTYSALQSNEIVELVMRMSSITKAYVAIPYVCGLKKHDPKRIAKVMGMLELASETPVGDLRAKLRAQFPLTGQPAREVTIRDHESKDRSLGGTIINYLARHNLHVINEKLFLPRADPLVPEVEYSWYAVTRTYLDRNRHRALTIDGLFGEMMTAWMASLDEDTRNEMLQEAYPMFRTLVGSLRHGDPNMWAFEVPGECDAKAEAHEECQCECLI